MLEFLTTCLDWNMLQNVMVSCDLMAYCSNTSFAYEK